MIRCRASCDDLRSALSSPLTGDTTLELSGDADCPILEDNELEEFTVEGGTLTLTGPSTTKFTNLKFTIMDQAGLIFDYDTTEFGPNLGYVRCVRPFLFCVQAIQNVARLS
ncbi:unnamed protein product [Ectocarpus sp. CCAP 1310/34]|nr:unnamed protein product [Ectocarpus sp. CCAP 1310/34]